MFTWHGKTTNEPSASTPRLFVNRGNIYLKTLFGAEMAPVPSADGLITDSRLVRAYNLVPDILGQLFNRAHGGIDNRR